MVGVGVGVAAAAAAAGAAYWLYGAKHSARHRKMAKSWMFKARAEVLDAVEKLMDVDKEKYMQIVKEVMQRYAKAGISAAETSQMMKDFKGAWSHMQAAKMSSTHGALTAKKVGKKMVRKARKAVGKKR